MLYSLDNSFLHQRLSARPASNGYEGCICHITPTINSLCGTSQEQAQAEADSNSDDPVTYEDLMALSKACPHLLRAHARAHLCAHQIEPVIAH